MDPSLSSYTWKYIRRPRGEFGHFKNGSLVSLISATPWSDVVQWYTARIFHNLEKPRVDNPSRRQKNWSPVALSDDVTHNIFNERKGLVYRYTWMNYWIHLNELLYGSLKGLSNVAGVLKSHALTRHDACAYWQAKEQWVMLWCMRITAGNI